MRSIEQQVDQDFGDLFSDIKRYSGAALAEQVRKEFLQIYTQNPDVLPTQINEIAILMRVESNYPLKEMADRQTSMLLG